MARTRFIGDTGLTARMTLVMFLLGGLFVGLMYWRLVRAPRRAIREWLEANSAA